ncbi:MAG: hypothetical protein JNL58_05405 [Planctomyces sp.]|nr:hypothetical protein [Planctomyces sp.]
MTDFTYIVFTDDHLIVTHKPEKVFVHRPEDWGTGETPFLQKIRDLLGFPVFPVHRLDRATSGLLMFARTQQAASELGKLFLDRKVNKTYLALVRGFTPANGVIDKPLRPRPKPGRAPKNAQPSVTNYQSDQFFELPICSDRYPTTRCTLLTAEPQTGRWHQIRRHLNHIHHPILGDTSHGDNTQNRFFRQQFQLDRLMLAATRLEFTHPFTGSPISVHCPPDHSFESLITKLLPYRVYLHQASPEIRPESELNTD